MILILKICMPASGLDTYHISTSDSLLTIGNTGGLPAILEIKSRGGHRLNWVKSSQPVSLIDHVSSGGKIVPLRWSVRNSTSTSGKVSSVDYILVSAPPLLEAHLKWLAHAGAGPVEQSLVYTNSSPESLSLPLPKSVDIAVNFPEGHQMEHWWVEKGAGYPAPVGTHRNTISSDYKFDQNSSPYSQDVPRELIPWSCLHDTIGNQGIYFGLESSARVHMQVHTETDKQGVNLVAGLDPSGGEFLSPLEANAKFEVPTVFIGCYSGSVDDGANRLHRFVEEALRPAVSDKRYPLIVNNSWGSQMAVTDELCRRMIRDSSQLGVELFGTDAGWFQGVGDWHPDPAKFPNGLGAISDFAHQNGMLFGLWVGWTQGGNRNRGSETLSVRNPQQREWFTKDYPLDWKPSDFIGADVCLATQPAQNWCLTDLRRVVSEFKLDMLEHDQRMAVDQCTRTDHGHSAHPADVSYHSSQGYNAVYDQLRSEHPKLLFEDCVNGGRMVDFSVVKRVHYISIVDSYEPLVNRQGFYDTSYPIPPSMCECYIGQYPGKTLATFITMLRSGMMGWCTIMCDTSAWSEPQRQAAKRQFEIYKTWLRPLINSGNLYHITPRPNGTDWDAMEYFDSKSGHGVVYVFRSKSEQTQQIFKIQGLKPKSSYNVRYEDGKSESQTMTGKELQIKGLSVFLNEKESSEIVYIEEAKG